MRKLYKGAIATVFMLLLPLLASCQLLEGYLYPNSRFEFVEAPEMGVYVPTLVVTPQDYDESDRKKYPVVYLLHGYSGDQRQWQKIADLEALADQFDILLVCPDGGHNSWYFDSPLEEDSAYESYILHHLLPHIDKTFKTRGPTARAITGLSMGGHGALRFLSVAPDSFVAAGSMSGILDLRVFPKSWQLAELLGAYKDSPARWHQESCVNRIATLAGKGKGILVDCGTEDFALPVNRAYRDSAIVHNLPINYVELPGGHDKAYWSTRLTPHLEFFQKYFK